MFKNTVLLMQKSGLLIEFKSDDVMRITFWNYGICWDILKGLLAKNVHFRANCLWDISPVMLRLLHTNPSKFAFVHNLINQTITWLISLRQFALKCQFLASRPLGCFFFKEYHDKSHNFTNLTLYDVTLWDSVANSQISNWISLGFWVTAHLPLP